MRRPTRLEQLFRSNRGLAAAPRVPEGTRVYAVGDIHGCDDLLAAMHRQIRADADAAPEERKVVVYLGDYVDRGTNSRAVIETLVSDPLDGFERVMLCGNHDAWMLEFLDDIDVGMPWLFNGGGATLLSYGVAGDARSLRNSLDQTQEAFRRALPAAHRRFLADLRLTYREGDYLFVHAGIRPGVAFEQQQPQDLLWIREGFLDSDADHGCLVVHGHTISEMPESMPNRIGIDTGAFATGRLTCLVLRGTERRFLQT